MPSFRRHALCAALAFAAAAAAADDERMVALRFFADNPHAQAATLTEAALRELQASAGVALRPLGRAADGAYLFATPADAAATRDAVNRLRATGALVYGNLLPPAAAAAAEPARALLVVLRAGGKRDAARQLHASLAAQLAGALPEPVALAPKTYRIGLPRTLAATEAAELIAAVAARADVEHVEIDRRARAASTPSDPMFASQWNLNDATGGINAPGAWAQASGDPAAPIAIIDSGTLPHPDLAPRVIGGYDFISDAAFAGDGDGRDGDATDPGDFVTAADASDPASPLHACPVTNSTWHGTMVAGAVAAVADNAEGVTPVNWSSPVVSIRVLGKCGGALSDIADGLRWAAGLPVAGAPPNAHPARVINLSLAGQGACGPILQAAVTDVLAAGAVIVAAAGNDSVDVADRWPANCNGVIAVAATSRNGSRAFYSNHGARIDVAAPGGGIGGSVPVLRNRGTTAADPAGHLYGQQIGTSLAAPQVAGVVSLMQARGPQLLPAEIQAILATSARAFPATAQDACSPATCGAGIVDAGAAVARAVDFDLLPIPAPTPLPAPLPPELPQPIPLPPPPPAPAPEPAPQPLPPPAP